MASELQDDPVHSAIPGLDDGAEPASTTIKAAIHSATTLDRSTDSATLSLYDAALGSSGTAHYTPIFSRFDAEDRASPGWNWAAALATLSWMAYRQLWAPALAYIGATSIAMLLIGLARIVLDLSSDAFSGLLLGLTVLSIVIPGLYGNAWLYQGCRKRMEAALSRNATVPEACAMLKGRMSARTRLVWIGLSNILLLIGLATLAALVPHTDDLLQMTGDTFSVPPAPQASSSVSAAPSPASASAASAAPAASATPAASAASAASDAAAMPEAASSAGVAASPAPAASEHAPAPTPTASTLKPVDASTTRAPEHTAHTEDPPLSTIPGQSTRVRIDKDGSISLIPHAAADPRDSYTQSRTRAPVPVVQEAPAPRSTRQAAAPDKARKAETADAADKTDPSEKAAKDHNAATAAKAVTPTRSAKPVRTAKAQPATPDSSANHTSADAPGFVINVGLFANDDNASKAARKLQDAGLPVQATVFHGSKGKRTRVRVGPYFSQPEADAAAERIHALQLDAVVIPRP